MKPWQALFTIALLLSLLAPLTHAQGEMMPPTAQKSLEKGLDALDHGQWDEAMQIFESLSEDEPDQPAPAYYLGVAAAHGGLQRPAFRGAEQILRLS